MEQVDDPSYEPLPRYWIASDEYRQRCSLEARTAGWCIAFRDVTNVISNTRTTMATIAPAVAFGNSVGLLHFPRMGNAARRGLSLLALMNAIPFDFIARQKLFGSHLNKYILWQLAVPTPIQLDSWNGLGCGAESFIFARALELAYVTASLEPLAAQAEYAGPPLRWDEGRRVAIRCELDAALFHLYLGTPKEWANGSTELRHYFSTPRHAVDCILDTFPILRSKEEAKYGSYRTKETILSIYDEMAEVIAANEAAVAAGHQPTAAYRTRLDPPPGPPADAAGNFLPLPEWKPGQPRPANWPRHIHAPRDVHEWAIANGIDWRELLDGPPGVLPKPTREPGAVPAARPAPIAARPGDAGVLPGFESAVAAIASESKRREREKELVLQAFRDVRDGRSPDYVIAAPDLNPRFLSRARELGVESPDAEVNLMLYGARKASKLKYDPTTKEYRLPRQVLPFVFASEWAIRHLQRELLTAANHEPSLDDILCNPELASRFDAVAARIKPGFSPLEYRWAALGLRKTGRQTAGELSIGFPLNQQLPLFDLDPADVPATPGLYLIQAEEKPLYVNATDDLRAQVLRHRDCAGQILVPDWLSAARGTPTRLSFAALYGADIKRLKEARIRHVADLQPWLNLLDLPGAA